MGQNTLYDSLPRTPVTPALAVGMATVYVADPTITPLSYTALAPWMHAGWSHLWQNLLFFLLLGIWIERRVGWLTFGVFAALIPYLALYLPVAFEYGGLSRGASGLTMALTGYAVPALLATLAERIDSFEFDAWEVALGLGTLLVFIYLTFDAWVTVKRFFYLAKRPDGVLVSAHFTGLVLGVLWFAWRGWRHSTLDA